MIQLICRNLATGHVDIIHEWPIGSVPFATAEEFRDWMVRQDQSTDYFYDIIEKVSQS